VTRVPTEPGYRKKLMKPSLTELTASLADRIVVLDGAVGTSLLAKGISEERFRGNRFADHPVSLSGNCDILSLSCPEEVTRVHHEFAAAGADIISTNTFNANSISQASRLTEPFLREMNETSVRLARLVADHHTQLEPRKRRYVAGVIGPTGRTCSEAPSESGVRLAHVAVDELRDAYAQQASALAGAGVDLLLIETMFDTANTRAALEAVAGVLQNFPDGPGIWISATVNEVGDRLLSGESISDFHQAVHDYDVFCVGLNCGYGVGMLRPALEDLASRCRMPVSVHPSAGLPNEHGRYPDSPDAMAAVIAQLGRAGLVNIVGGCCGTTPEHIRQISQAVGGLAPRAVP
jgi:5-methyltetrahydrofolate--homocysteine methyltransferase